MWDNDMKEGCAWVVALLILFTLSIFLGPLFFMLCWNYALCAAFVAVPTVTYWQAFGVCILLDIIAASFIVITLRKNK